MSGSPCPFPVLTLDSSISQGALVAFCGEQCLDTRMACKVHALLPGCRCFSAPSGQSICVHLHVCARGCMCVCDLTGLRTDVFVPAKCHGAPCCLSVSHVGAPPSSAVGTQDFSTAKILTHLLNPTTHTLSFQICLTQTTATGCLLNRVQHSFAVLLCHQTEGR